MLNAFHLGGWGMYPTLIFGVLAIGAAVHYAWTRERRRLALVGVLSLVTLAAGTLGFVTGMMATLSHSSGMPNQSAVIAEGTFESLNCVSLALALFVIAGLVTAVGVWRSGSAGGEATTEPARQQA